MNFVIIARQPWEEKNMGSNIRDMARALAPEHRVLFVNQPLDWAALYRRDGRHQERKQFIEQNAGQALTEAEPNLWVWSPTCVLGSFNWLPDNAIYDYFNRWNGQKLATGIRRVLAELKWDSFVLLNDNDMIQGFYLKELLKPESYVYYLRDNFLAVNYWKKHGQRLEPALMSKVDVVASNSGYLANQASRYNPRSVYIGQGCDLELFNPNEVSAIPEDLNRIPQPRIGYAGALTSLRLDGALIETIARERPDWQIVLIGSPDDSFPRAQLEDLNNVTFLGSKPPHEIPAYLAHMDVLINPQVFNEVTIGNYPRKIDEYLAMGKPVVAVKTETMELFRDHVFLADSPQSFIHCIEQALSGQHLSTAAERIAFALDHTWENSLQLMIDAIYQFKTTSAR